MRAFAWTYRGKKSSGSVPIFPSLESIGRTTGKPNGCPVLRAPIVQIRTPAFQGVRTASTGPERNPPVEAKP